MISVLRIILSITFVYVTAAEAVEKPGGSQHPEEPMTHGVESQTDALHDHGERDHLRSSENHADEGHGEGLETEDSHDHTGEIVVTVSDAGSSMAGIKLATVERRRLSQTIALPGEIGFNQDRLVHITPRYSGVVKEVLRSLGEFVEEDAALAVIESNHSLTTYVVRAPFSGHIIEKHAIPGEYLSEETSMYVIADLSSVWVNLDVYARHMESVSVGSTVTIRAVSMAREAVGVVSYVAPLFDQAKRAAIARVVLPNSEMSWRPGTFVSAELEIATEDSIASVEKEAIQMIDGENYIFVPFGVNRFRPVEVILGSSGTEYVEILSSLSPGDSYVAQGAFQLKAEMITSSLGAHAGHGH